jgi:hypothetical protein
MAPSGFEPESPAPNGGCPSHIRTRAPRLLPRNPKPNEPEVHANEPLATVLTEPEP